MAIKTIKTTQTSPSSGGGKKALIVIVSLLAIGGVVGYFLWKRNKDKKAKQDVLDAEKKKAEADALANQQNQGGNVSGSGTITGNLQMDLPTLNFQKWHNSKGYTPKLTEDGFNGNKTKSAFAKYGADFTKETNSPPPATTPTMTGDFNTAWNTAKSLNIPSFIFGGKAYDTISGKPYIDPSVIQVGDNVYAKEKLGGYAWYDGTWKSGQYWSGGSSFGNFQKNQLVGKVVEIKGNGLKVENTFKPMITSDNSYNTKFWVYAPLVTKVKPSVVVSFDGETNLEYQP